MRDIFRADADSGLHAAAEWLLRQWKDETWLKQTMDELAGDKEQRELRFENIRRSLTGSDQQTSHDWYINSQGQTLIVVQGPTEFTMGSPDLNDGQVNKERRHTRRISRSFSIATTPVTVEQYRRIDADYGNGLPPDWVRAETLPVIGINWFMGAKVL